MLRTEIWDQSFGRSAVHGLKTLGKILTGRQYLDEINSRVINATNLEVIQGPFRGMHYIEAANSSALAPKLLGTYEKELVPYIEQIIATPYTCVIDIGSAEGYYAVGLALTMPNVPVHAYDVDVNAIKNLESLANINNVRNRVTIGHYCDAGEINRFRAERCLVICDTEGAEIEILDPCTTEALTHFDILVEIHDGCSSTRIHDVLAERFAKSHQLEFVRYRERSSRECPRIPGVIHPRARKLAVDEFRTFGIEWGFFRALANCDPPTIHSLSVQQPEPL